MSVTRNRDERGCDGSKKGMVVTWSCVKDQIYVITMIDLCAIVLQVTIVNIMKYLLLAVLEH